MSRSSSTTNAFVVAALALGSAAAAAAQSTQVHSETYTLRRAPIDSTDRQQRRLQRELDSLTQVYYENEDLTVAERRRVAEALERTAARLTAVAASARGTMTLRATRMAPMGSMMPAQAQSDMARALMQMQTAQAVMPKGWIGIVAEGVGEEPRVQSGQLIIRYLSYPRIVSVDPGSPAQRAGLMASDTLLAYDGRDVRENDISLSQLLRPNARISVRVLRDGRVREVPVTVAPVPSRVELRRDNEIRESRTPWVVAGVPDAPGFPRSPAPAPMASGGSSVRVSTRGTIAASAPLPPMAPRPPVPAVAQTFTFGVNGVAGAQLLTITEGLGRTLGIRNGVLVTSAPVGSPAYDSGLADGDVITRVAGREVRTVPEVRSIVAEVVANGERSVELMTMRERRVRRVVLRW